MQRASRTRRRPPGTGRLGRAQPACRGRAASRRGVRARMRVPMVSGVYFPRIKGVATSMETLRRGPADLGVEIRPVAPSYGAERDLPVIALSVTGTADPREPRRGGLVARDEAQPFLHPARTGFPRPRRLAATFLRRAGLRRGAVGRGHGRAPRGALPPHRTASAWRRCGGHGPTRAAVAGTRPWRVVGLDAAGRKPAAPTAKDKNRRAGASLVRT